MYGKSILEVNDLQSFFFLSDMFQLAVLNAYVSAKATKFYGTPWYLELVLPELSSLVWTQKVNVAC